MEEEMEIKLKKLQDKQEQKIKEMMEQLGMALEEAQAAAKAAFKEEMESL